LKKDDSEQRLLDYSGIEAMWTEKLTEQQKKTGNELIKAAGNQNTGRLKMYISGGDGLIKSAFGKVALKKAIVNKKSKSVEMLLDANKDFLKWMGLVFYDACLFGRIDTVKWVINFLQTYVDKRSNSIFSLQSGQSNLDSVSVERENSSSSLNWLCFDKVERRDASSIVLEYKDNDGPFGWSPLQAASRMGHKEVVKELIDHVDINAITKHGSTALLLAAYYGKTECVKLLVKAKTDETKYTAETKNRAGYTGMFAIDWAKKKNHTEIVKILEDYNIKEQPNSQKRRASLEKSHPPFKRQYSVNIIARPFESSAQFYAQCCQSKGDELLQYVRSTFDQFQKKHPEKLKEVLEYRDNDAPQGWTPLHAVTRYGHTEVVKELLNHGADITATAKDNATVLNVAIQYKQTDCAEVLIDFAIKEGITIVLTKEWNGKTPLKQAQELKRRDIVTHLQTASIGWNRCFDFYELCTAGKHKEIKQILEELYPGEGESKEETANDMQVRERKKEEMKALLEFRDMDGPLRWTPLHSATRYGRIEVLKVLLDYGAKVGVDVDEETKLGSNALFLAAYYGQAECAQQLINFGSKVATEYKGMNALQWARKRQLYDVIRVLEKVSLTKKKKAKRNNGELSPEDFYAACNEGLYNEVKKALKLCKDNQEEKAKLFEYRAEPPLEWVPLHVAARMGHHKILELLLINGADLEALTGLKSNALILAAFYGQPECARVLLKHKIDPYVKFNGKTPLQWAESKGHESVVEVIKKYTKNQQMIKKKAKIIISTLRRPSNEEQHH